MPNDTNMLGNLLGGRLLHWIDIAGALSAMRHSSGVVTTASIDSVNFLHPVKMGEIVTLTASVIWTGRTSMTVLVCVTGENASDRNVRATNEAKLTFVALDSEGKPRPVPALIPGTPKEQELFNSAQKKYEKRKLKETMNK